MTDTAKEPEGGAVVVVNVLPCPFCGARPSLRRAAEVGYWIVMCANDSCDMTVKSVECRNPENAANVWNRRPRIRSQP